MRTLITVEIEPGESVSVAIDETYLEPDGDGEAWLYADPIPLTADRAMTLATALIEWAKEQSK